MDQKLIESTVKKLDKLQNSTFINVIFDNWRGPRFIFDTEEVRNCNNDCKDCDLFKLLKRKAPKELFPATKEDKQLFGRQNFLNCKTLEQYGECYINFILKKANTLKEIKKELKLIKNLKIVYSKETNNLSKLQREFKNNIIKAIIRKASKQKKEIIVKALNITKTI